MMQQFEFGDKVWCKTLNRMAVFVSHQTKLNYKSAYVIPRCGSIIGVEPDSIEPYTNQDQPRTRPMTRDEILHFVTTTPRLVVKREREAEARPANYYYYQEGDLAVMLWAYASKTGDYKWNKFEVEE